MLCTFFFIFYIISSNAQNCEKAIFVDNKQSPNSNRTGSKENPFGLIIDAFRHIELLPNYFCVRNLTIYLENEIFHDIPRSPT